MLNVSEWFYVKGNLDDVFGYGAFQYEDYGFSVAAEREAVAMGNQFTDDDSLLHTLMPIVDRERFFEILYPRLDPEKCIIVTNEEAMRMLDEWKAIRKERDLKYQSTPTKEDVLMSQIMLALTEISLNTKTKEEV